MTDTKTRQKLTTSFLHRPPFHSFYPRNTSFNMLSLLLLLLLLPSYFHSLLAYLHHPILATIATSSSDLLPARITLLSATTAGSLPNGTVLTLLTTPSVSLRQAEAIAQKDNIDHVRLSEEASHFPLLSLFLLPAHQKVLFLSQYTLVTASLSPLFHCPSFCASFISPCSFSSSFMSLTPNDTTHAALTRLANRVQHPSSPCSDPPDWLSAEACILNHYFGKQLITAPLFHPDNVPENAPLPIQQPYQLRRLPMGCHVPHYLYYPRFQWEVPETPCGIQRAINFQSPRLLRPWYWWTYLFMKLSWEWRVHRLQLLDSDTVRKDRHDFIVRICLLVLICAIASFLGTHSFDGSGWRRIQSDPNQAKTTLAEPVLVLYVVTLGGTGWLLSWVIGFAATPAMITFPLALPLLICYQIVMQTIAWVGLGFLFIKNHAIPGESRYPRSARRAALETFYMVAFGMVFLSVMLQIANRLDVETMYERVGLLVGAGFCYVSLVLWLLGRLCIVWVSVGVK